MKSEIDSEHTSFYLKSGYQYKVQEEYLIKELKIKKTFVPLILIIAFLLFSSHILCVSYNYYLYTFLTLRNPTKAVPLILMHDVEEETVQNLNPNKNCTFSDI